MNVAAILKMKGREVVTSAPDTSLLDIAEVLGMTVDAAWEFFAEEPHLHRALGVVVRDCLRHGGHVPSRTSVMDLRWLASGYVPCSSRRWSSPGPRAARRPRLVSAGWHPAGNM